MLNRMQWIKQYYPTVEAITKGTGIFPEIALSQAILESSAKYNDGFYYPAASRLAIDANNLYGIKATKSWKGDTITLPTTEVVNGKKITVTATFRKYPTIEDSFKDYIKFLQENPRYKKAGVFSATTWQQQAAALQRAGYATDPNYSNLLVKVVNSFKNWIPKIKTPFLALATGIFFFMDYFKPKKT